MNRLWIPGVAAVVLAAVGLVACAREAQVESGPAARVGEAGPDTVTGTVRQVGNLPFARTIIRSEEDTVGVLGEYEEELAHLVGAEVRASGERTAGPLPGPHLRVTSYEIVAIDGQRPSVGFLRNDADGYFLETQAGDLRLRDVPTRVQRAVGGRIWVVADEQGSILRYGILREAEGAEEARESDPA